MGIFKCNFSREHIALSLRKANIELGKSKHYTDKQHLIKQQTALSKQALYIALHTKTIKQADSHD